MRTDGAVKTTCDICSQGCGVLAHIKDGRPVRIEGDPDSPINRGAICPKGSASLEYVYHKDRLKYPLRRIGERGEGKWQEVPWGEALGLIAEKFTKARKENGAETVAFIGGSNKGIRDNLLVRLANVFGSPNRTWTGHVCFMPRRLASVITFGFDPYPDYEWPPALIINWASNPAASRFYDYEQTIQALERGTKLMVINPIRTELAKKADLWIQLRPGSDLALALGMIHVLIEQGLFDRDFVERWTSGFDELAGEIKGYSPKEVEEITWVAAERIEQAAKLYISCKPACMQLGNAIDHGINSFQTARAVSILRAISGNLGIPGGEVHWAIPSISGSPEMRLNNELTEEVWKRRAERDYGVLPFLREGLPQAITKAILSETAYPIRMAYIQACNPVITWSNSQETYQALQKLEFFAVADFFMTPTAGLADLVLPAATYLEFDNIAAPSYYPGIQVQQKVASVGECWSDHKIIIELAKSLGLGQYFWTSETEALEDILRLWGVSFEEFRKLGFISGTRQYRHYERDGFQTPSRKVEIYSSELEKWRFDPLPTYREPPETPYSDPGLAQEYPFIFTSWKSPFYRHSTGRQIASLRGMHSDPVIMIHPETAGKLRIQEGDWVFIETMRGRIKQKALLTNEIDPRVVGVDYAWWFPEKGISEQYGWKESNINMLTDNEPPYNREMGSLSLRGILCRVHKAST